MDMITYLQCNFSTAATPGGGHCRVVQYLVKQFICYLKLVFVLEEQPAAQSNLNLCEVYTQSEVHFPTLHLKY